MKAEGGRASGARGRTRPGGGNGETDGSGESRVGRGGGKGWGSSGRHRPNASLLPASWSLAPGGARRGGQTPADLRKALRFCGRAGAGSRWRGWAGEREKAASHFHFSLSSTFSRWP